MPAAWLVRAGGHGEREQLALRESIASIGWGTLGDLADCKSRADLHERLRHAYPEASRAVLGNWTGQLWRFLSVIADGDHVVMPLKTELGMLAVGRVTGPYYYEAEAEPEVRHRRPVEWLRRVPREYANSDLRDSLQALLTVCELRRHDAGARVAALAAGQPDPGWAPHGVTDANLEDKASLFTRALDETAAEPLRVSIRQLLQLYGTSRRTDGVLELIESELAENGLTTSAPIGEGWLDNVIAVVPLRPSPEEADGAGAAASPDPAATRAATGVRAAGTDPTAPAVSLSISTLEAAGAGVLAVKVEDSLTKAITLMLQHDYSQLAVLSADGVLRGAVSWESIGRARLAKQVLTLADAVVDVRTVLLTDDLLGVVADVRQYGYVLVRDPGDQAITGIVTTADLAGEFEAISKPFALAEECERRLRRRVDERIDPQLIGQHVRNKKHADQGAAALTMGAYGFLLKEPATFELLGWDLDHELFLAHLEQVRLVRNELMHFSTDPLDPKDVAALLSFIKLLRAVDRRL